MKTFRNKYRIESARLPSWDYGWEAGYFITICTANRELFFGEVVNGKMVLSEIGKLVELEWLKTCNLRPDMNLKLDEFVVMPNHFHAILWIGKNEYNQRDRKPDGDGENDGDITKRGDIIDRDKTKRRDAMHCVSTSKIPKIPENPETSETSENPESSNNPQNQFGPQSKNLASIIRGFKSAVTVNARKINPDFAWQARFHDRIIRDDVALQQIRWYIINNPHNWGKDDFHDK